MAVNVNDIIITSLETITAFDLTTGAYKYTLDELQNATIAQTQDKSDATGKGGRKISSLKRNKAVTISGANGLVSGGLLETQTGGTFANKATEVMWTETLVVSSNGATTTYKAVGTLGAEIEELFIRNENGTLGAKLTQDDSASEGKFTYDPSSKAIAFYPSDVSNVKEVVVFYKRKITADVLVNESDKYSGKETLYVDALGEDKCGNVYRIQIHIPKADFSGEFSLEIGNDQTVHEFEAEALAGACGAGGQLWTYTIFGVNTSDDDPIGSH